MLPTIIFQTFPTFLHYLKKYIYINTKNWQLLSKYVFINIYFAFNLKFYQLLQKVLCHDYNKLTINIIISAYGHVVIVVDLALIILVWH
jgi:hypothetical protein